jgi:hypothetical protein
MAFVTADISMPLDFYDPIDRSTYTVDSQLYESDTLYVMMIEGDASTNSADAIPSSVTTSGITWDLIHSKTNGVIALSQYRGVPSEEVIETTTVVFPATQNRMRCQVTKTDNAGITNNGAEAVIQTATDDETGDVHAITLATITSGNVAISSHALTSSAQRTWSPTSGFNGVSLSSESTSHAYTQYNISDEETLSVDLSSANAGISIAVEIAYAGDPNPSSAHTIVLTDDGLITGNAVICSSADFSLGVSASVYRDATPAVEEVATLIEAISEQATAEIQLDITFPDGPPVTGDVIKITYDDAVGDIKAATGDQPLASFTNFEGTTCS